MSQILLDSNSKLNLRFMAKYYNWFLLLPILLLMLGTYILLSGEVRLHTLDSRTETVGQQAPQGEGYTEGVNMRSTVSNDLKDNRDSAFQYFVLGSGLLVALLLFPKLGELSFSPTSGFTLKVISDVKEAIEEVHAATLAVEHKTNKMFRTSMPEAAAAPAAPAADLRVELLQLEAGKAKLQAYAALLSKNAPNNA